MNYGMFGWPQLDLGSLIERKEANDQLSIDFNLLPDEFDLFLIFFKDVQIFTGSGSPLMFQVGDESGFKTSSYKYHISGVDSSSLSYNSYISSAGTEYPVVPVLMDTTNRASGWIAIAGVHSTDVYKNIFSMAQGFKVTSIDPFFSSGGGAWVGGYQKITKLIIFGGASNNMKRGIFELHGLMRRDPNILKRLSGYP